MKPRIAIFTVLLAISMAGLSAMADTPVTVPLPPTAAPTPQEHEWCSQHQQECQQRTAERKQWCENNKEQCKALLQKKRTKIEAYCKQNPTDERCQKLMQRLQDQPGKAPNTSNSPPPPQ